MTTSDLRAKFWKKGQEPFHARTVITGLVQSLVDKTKQMKEGYRVFKSERAGPRPIEVWAKPL